MSESKLHFGAKSSNGGPLGELLQWSDLIAVLFLLGHNLYISSEKATLKKHVERFIDSPCPTDLDKIDLIITDIIGLQSFKQHKAYLLENRCRIRLVDSFGTHVEFNYKSYFNSHRQELRNEETGKSRNPWGGHGLRLLQYWTFYPHTADNSFLGFVVDTSNAKPLFERRSRNALLIYGKEQYMWKGSEKIISVLKQFTEIHATVSDATVNSTMFTDIINHGFLDAVSVNSLLKSVKIFFGLGFPFEEFTPSGMLLRVNLLISRQNICRESENNWPPKEALQSCELACSQEDLVCEPTFFPLINTYELLVKFVFNSFI
uniref:alpha-1,6-mannosyl-glycoprotein 6-beta-N-acetylglucosaminyltransferase n=1 Tax=Heterorhabditis bacteriophora TaxID=37862 RepID=A0A1I7WIT1_HETBA